MPLPPVIPVARPATVEPVARDPWWRVLLRPGDLLGDRGRVLAAGAFAGVQGALLSYLVIVVPTMAAYVATSADPANDQVGWPRSVAVGGALWLLGQGGPLPVDGGAVTLVPLGLTALVVFGAYASARRSAPPRPDAWAAAVVGHLAVVAVVLVGVGRTGPLGVGPGAVARALLGAAVVAALGLGWGTARRGRVVRWLARRTAGWPAWLTLGVRAGGAACAMLVLGASLITVTWVFVGRAASGDVMAALGADPFGGAVLAIAQTTLAPDLVLWALSWLVGTGFAVGAGTSFAPDQVVSGPMPALPLLGALPAQAGGGLTWAPAVVALVGVLVGLWLHRSLDERATWHPLAAAVVAGATGAVLIGLLAAASAGAVGTGRMAVVGPAAGLVLLDALVLLVPGVALAVVPASGLVRAAARRQWDRAWRLVAGRVSRTG